MTINETVFSEYEVRQMNAIFSDGSIYHIKCVGQLEEESEVVTVTKKCRGVTAKTVTKGTGSGTLTLTAHMPVEMLEKMRGMTGSDLVSGVKGFGRTKFEGFGLTALILDEDENEEYAYWPKCTANTGPTRSIENGADEVAEAELEIAYSADDNGYGSYQARVGDLDDTLAEKWMEGITSDDLVAPTA